MLAPKLISTMSRLRFTEPEITLKSEIWLEIFEFDRKFFSLV